MLNGACIGLLEARAAQSLASLVARHGGRAMSAPALAETPVVERAHVLAMVDALETRAPDLAIFQTGAGTRALFEAVALREERRRLARLLQSGLVVVRGPKPVGVLRYEGVRIDRSTASPHTGAQLLDCLGDLDVRGRQVLVQRYGEVNEALTAWLLDRGGSVREVPAYRWALPEDLGPVERLIDGLTRGTVDALVFTSASQVENLIAAAARFGREAATRAALGLTPVVSIGPVCSAALRREGIAVAVEATPPKLGHLVPAIARALGRAVH